MQRKQRRRSDQLRGAISAFVFATWSVQYIYFLNPNFQVSSHPSVAGQSGVCVGPGRKSRKQVCFLVRDAALFMPD